MWRAAGTNPPTPPPPTPPPLPPRPLSLSLFFPLGEHFFIESVQRHRASVPPGSPLAANVTAFVKQEALHSREHELYNAALQPHAAVGLIESVIRGVLAPFRAGPRCLALAGTAGLEHLTAALGHTLLADPLLDAGSEPHYAALWRWHAYEETEHKAVAFDVYEAAYGRGVAAYALRAAAYLVAMAIFLALFLPAFLYMCLCAGCLFDLPSWGRLVHKQWAAPGPGSGALRRILPLLADYLRPGFHPWQHENSDLLLGGAEKPPPREGAAS